MIIDSYKTGPGQGASPSPEFEFCFKYILSPHLLMIDGRSFAAHCRLLLPPRPVPSNLDYEA